MTEKLKEQVIRTIREEDDTPDGDEPADDGPVNGQVNGHDSYGNGDVSMTDPEISSAGPSRARSGRSESLKPEIKLDVDEETDLICPEEAETHPPVHPVFRIADLKREVESVRDKRKMIRLGPGVDPQSAGPPLLPSVLAVTMFDSGEG